MKENNTKIWVLIAAIAAAVAAVTTIVILVVRARQKAMSVVEPIYDCGCCDETAEECACTEEVVAEENTAE